MALEFTGRDPPADPFSSIHLPNRDASAHATAPLPHLAKVRLQSERRLALWATTLLLVPNVLGAYVDISLVTSPATLDALQAMRAMNVPTASPT